MQIKGVSVATEVCICFENHLMYHTCALIDSLYGNCCQLLSTWFWRYFLFSFFLKVIIIKSWVEVISCLPWIFFLRVVLSFVSTVENFVVSAVTSVCSLSNLLLSICVCVCVHDMFACLYVRSFTYAEVYVCKYARSWLHLSMCMCVCSRVHGPCSHTSPHLGRWRVVSVNITSLQDLVWTTVNCWR